MRILFDDLIQRSDAPSLLKSPSLADISEETSFIITLDATEQINAIGIGNTDATEFIVNGETIALDLAAPYNQYKNGLYLLTTQINTNTLTITHDGTYVGRISAGYCPRLKASKAREPGFTSTHQNRETLSGQTIPGAGGISRRRIDVDFRYQFDSAIWDQIAVAHPTQLAKGFPLFICFEECEQEIFPYNRLYGKTDTSLLFQSSVRRFLYSRKFSFLEAF